MIKADDTNYFAYEMIGEFRSEGNWIHPTRIIDSYEVIFVIDGIVYIEEDNIRYELHRNDILLLEPGKPHEGFKISNSPTAFYWFHFNTSMRLDGKLFTGDEYYDIKYLLKKLLHISNTPGYSSAAADAAGLLIFEELSCLSNTEPRSAFANRLAEYIRINTDKSITAAAVAKHFGYNPDYITKLFKKYFDVGIKEYIYSSKLKKAKDLLLTTEFSIKEISYMLGFKEENLFVKFFIYHEGISPSRFRNKLHNTHMNNK